MLAPSTSRTIACATKWVTPRSRSTVEVSAIRASTGRGSSSAKNVKPARAGSGVSSALRP